MALPKVRYPFTLARRDEEQLQSELAALAPPGFAGVCGSGATVEVLFDAAPGRAVLDRVAATVAAHVPRTDTARAKAATLAAIRTASDPNSRGNRATVTVLFTWLNDLREHAGLPRYTEPDILAAIAAATEQGAGEPR